MKFVREHINMKSKLICICIREILEIRISRNRLTQKIKASVQHREKLRYSNDLCFHLLFLTCNYKVETVIVTVNRVKQDKRGEK